MSVAVASVRQRAQAVVLTLNFVCQLRLDFRSRRALTQHSTLLTFDSVFCGVIQCTELMLQPPARDRALAADGLRPSQQFGHTTHNTPLLAASPGIYPPGSEAELRLIRHRLHVDAVQSSQRSHPIRKPATMLPTQQPPWRLSYNVDKLSEAWTFERPVASAAPRPRRFHYGVETPTARASSSVMSPSECAAAYRTRPNALHRDGEFINLLALCEAERHESDDVVRSSNEWRKHWKEQQELQPLPPPSYRDISWPRQLLV